MNLNIKVQGKEIELELKDGKRVLDKIKWKDENDLSLSLLKNLDKLLKKNNLRIMDFKKSDVKIINAGFSTERILTTVSRTVNYCLTN